MKGKIEMYIPKYFKIYKKEFLENNKVSCDWCKGEAVGYFTDSKCNGYGYDKEYFNVNLCENCLSKNNEEYHKVWGNEE